MPARELVALYGQLATTVARMLELARSRRWALLPELDAECTELAARMRARPAEGCSAAERGELQALASRIRCDCEHLNALVRPQFLQLVQRLGERGPEA